MTKECVIIICEIFIPNYKQMKFCLEVSYSMGTFWSGKTNLVQMVEIYYFLPDQEF